MNNLPEVTQKILRRVGNVLIVLGVLDILLMVVVVFSGYSYSSSFNIFAVIAGILIRRGSLRTVRVVRFFAGVAFGGTCGLFLLFPFLFPFDLILTYLRLSNIWAVAGWISLLVALQVVLGWIIHQLSTTPIDVGIKIAQLSKTRLWHRSGWGALFGIGLTTFIFLVLSAFTGGETAQKAIERARDQMGPDHRYFVQSVSIAHSQRHGTHVWARVLAYTDTSIQPLTLEWAE